MYAHMLKEDIYDTNWTIIFVIFCSSVNIKFPVLICDCFVSQLTIQNRK